MLRPLTLVPLLALVASAAGAQQLTPTDAHHVHAMAREHANERPTPSAGTAVAPRLDVITSEVVYHTSEGKAVRGFLARPARVAKDAALPGVVVIHEWWGLNDNVRDMTRRIAGEGYQALAVDMYGGQIATDAQGAQGLMRQVMSNRAGGVANIESAMRWLREHGAAKIGIIGWCFGGAWSLQGALFAPQYVDAAVMYYGQVVTDTAQLRRLDAPLLGLFGAEDRGIPVAGVREMQSILTTLGKTVEIHVYEGAGHAFANASGQSYRAEPAEDAWRRTVDWFQRYLK